MADESLALASIALIGSRTVFDERGHAYTLYTLRVATADGDSYNITRRFSDFRELARSLAERHKTVGDAASPPDLPKSILSAGWFSGQTTISPEFVARRKKGLHGWLQALLAALPADDSVLVGAMGGQRTQAFCVMTSSSLAARGRSRRRPRVANKGRYAQDGLE